MRPGSIFNRQVQFSIGEEILSKIQRAREALEAVQEG